jgi:putative transposase
MSRENGGRKRSMNTFTKLTYHIVFSTKYRLPLIRNGFQKRIYEYIGGIEDHIHLLANLLLRLIINISLKLNAKFCRR